MERGDFPTGGIDGKENGRKFSVILLCYVILKKCEKKNELKDTETFLAPSPQLTRSGRIVFLIRTLVICAIFPLVKQRHYSVIETFGFHGNNPVVKSPSCVFCVKSFAFVGP